MDFPSLTAKVDVQPKGNPGESLCCWHIILLFSSSPHRLVVRTSRCGRDIPGSTPGEDIFFALDGTMYPIFFADRTKHGFSFSLANLLRERETENGSVAPRGRKLSLAASQINTPGQDRLATFSVLS